MPKVTGPLFSLTASGTYQGLLTYRTGQGRTTVSSPSVSKKTRSSAQIEHSANIAAMAEYWSGMPEIERQAWRNRAAQAQLQGRALFWREWIAQQSTPENPPVVPH